MKQIKSILIPTDLSEHSRRALVYGAALAANNDASITIMHVARDQRAWAYVHDEFGMLDPNAQSWPDDRVLAEATLDLNRFLDAHLPALKRIGQVKKRVVLGGVAEEIVAVASEERVDLVITSPRRKHSLRHWFSSSVTDRVTRLSPCPVLAVTEPLPSPGWRGQRYRVGFGWLRPRAATVA